MHIFRFQISQCALIYILYIEARSHALIWKILSIGLRCLKTHPAACSARVAVRDGFSWFDRLLNFVSMAPMKAMKAMKATKAMKAMAAMKAMKGGKVMTKGALASELAEAAELKKAEVTKLLEALAEIGTKEASRTKTSQVFYANP